MKPIITCGLILVIQIALYGQSKTNVAALQRLADELHERYEKERAEAESWAYKNNVPIRQTFPNGKEVELMGIKNGIPVYYTTFNLDAAKTISSNQVWPGGGANYNLTGANIIIGIWDTGDIVTS